MMAKAQFVAVTHFINPQLFWYHKIDVPNDNFHKIIQIEQQLSDLYKSKPKSGQFRPVVGDVVVVRFVSWNKYIRARVEDVAHFSNVYDEYIVWALDYGFPFQTKLEFMRRIPDSMTMHIDHIRCGGLANIVPGEKEFDLMEGNAVMAVQEEWNQRACDTLAKLISDAASVTFVEQFQTENDRYWGDLKIVNHIGKTFSACKTLVDINVALNLESKFEKVCLSLKTIRKACWLSNRGEYKLTLNNVHMLDMTSNDAKENTCDTHAIRKVEDWCKRNERGNLNMSVDSGENHGGMSIDDIAFEDSVSLKHASIDDCELAEEEQGFMRLGGCLTKLKSSKYANTSFYQIPDDSAFEISPPKESLTENKRYEGIPEEASSIVSSSVSNRKKKIIEMRKKIAMKQAEQKQTPADSTTSDVQPHNICDFSDLTLKDALDGRSEQQTSSEISVNSVRAKQLTALRRKYSKEVASVVSQNEQNNDAVSSSYKFTNNNNHNEQKSTISSAIYFQNDDNFRKDNITSTSSQISNKSIGLREKHSVAGIKDNSVNNNKHDDFVTISSPPQNLGILEKTLPERHRQNNFQFPDLRTPNSTRTNQKPKDPFDGFTVIPAGYDFVNLSRYKDEESHWHRRTTTLDLHVPHDNINPSEEVLQNISHNANSSWSSGLCNATYSDGNKTFDETAESSKNILDQNFRHTRSHTEKYKENKQTEKYTSCGDKFEKNILDLSIPDLAEFVLKPSTTKLDDGKLHNHCDTKEYKVPSAESGDISQCKSSDQSSIKKYKRRQLKSPADQMNKIDDLLRRANFEKERGNSDILDLQNLNTSSSKSECDSIVESLLLDNSNSTTGSESKENQSSSNKRALVEKRLLQKTLENKEYGDKCLKKVNHDQTKLDKLAKELNFELNLMNKSTNSRTVISLPRAETIREISGEKKLQTKFIDHLVLAHSKVPVYPLEKTTDACFLQEIHDEMFNMHVTKVYRIQAYSWSYLLRGNSLFVVNPMKSGKTWCYLPPICNLVSYRMQNSAVPQSYGPVAIIIVSSSTKVEKVNGYCRRLLTNAKGNITTVPSYGIRNTREVKIQLLNGCGILVATPANLLRLLQEREPLIDPDRLHHLVIDDLDLILSRSKNDFKTVFQIIVRMVKKPKQETVPLQIVVTSRDWNSVMFSIMNLSNEPLLLIGDFLEAAVYGKANILIKLCPREKKLSTVLKFVSKRFIGNEHFLIVCNCDQDMDDVVHSIIDSGQACIGYGHSSSPEVRVTIEEWNRQSSCSQIVVCTDEVLPELKLQNVKILIHYSMPTSWTKFTMRFSTMAKCYENFVAKGFPQNIPKEALTFSLILLDEDNNIQLPRLIDFMKKHDQIKNIHPDILSVSKRVRMECEESRIFQRTLLCPILLEFGDCDEPGCDHRHNFTTFDRITQADDIPTSGDMRIKILKVFSPTHYTARLLEHKPPNETKWKTIRRSDEAALFGMQLNMHYMNPDNWVLHWPFKLNDLCIYKVSDTYQRALILDVPQLEHTDIVKKIKVTIKLIDLGTVITCCKSDELFVCDEKFIKFPYQAIDIRLDGVIPHDNERTWDSKATKVVQKWIMTDITKNECVYVHINFTLAKTVWVKNVIVMERLPTVGQHIYKVNVKRSLIEKNFGCLRSGEECRHVRDIAEEFGLLVEEDEDINYNNINCDSANSSNLMKFSSNDEDSLSSIKLDDNITPIVRNPMDNRQIQKLQKQSGEFEENWDNEDNKENEIFIPLANCKQKMSTHSESIEKNHKSEDCVLEKWCKLPLKTITKVEIGDELENGNWANIYMQIVDDTHKKQFEELQNNINEYIENIKKMPKKSFNATWFKSMRNCIVKYQNIYCRAQVHAVYGNESKRLYRFFLCDLACFVTVKETNLYSDFLYETERKIVEYTPYQAVHCTLAGIKIKEFSKRHPVVNKHLFAYAVIERDCELANAKELKIHSFDILLYECEKNNDIQNATMLNQTLVDHNLAYLDSNTKQYLELSNIIAKPDDSKPDFDNEESDNVVSYEELVSILERTNDFYEEEEKLAGIKIDDINIIHEPFDERKDICRESLEPRDNENYATQIQNIVPYSKKISTNPFEYVEEIDEDVLSSSSQFNYEQSSNRSNSPISPPPPPLTALHKRPKTEWYDTDYLIYIVIRAPDIKDYYLEVTKNSLLFTAFINEEEHVLILNFLGTVEPEFVSHEIRGLNVVVRLLKSIFMKWPRLLQQSTKCPWLSYNYNAIDTKDHIQLQQKMDLAFKDTNPFNDQNDSDADDDEAVLYQTYTPIVNTDDINDPVTDVF